MADCDILSGNAIRLLPNVSVREVLAVKEKKKGKTDT